MEDGGGVEEIIPVFDRFGSAVATGAVDEGLPDIDVVTDDALVTPVVGED